MYSGFVTSVQVNSTGTCHRKRYPFAPNMSQTLHMCLVGLGNVSEVSDQINYSLLAILGLGIKVRVSKMMPNDLDPGLPTTVVTHFFAVCFFKATIIFPNISSKISFWRFLLEDFGCPNQDGLRILTSSAYDGTARLWDVAGRSQDWAMR